MKDPKFSIIIPSCNEGNMLHMTVEDILANTQYSDGYEIIIVDDGSTDGSCNRYQNGQFRENVRVVETPHIGVARARNEGFNQSSAPYVVFLDAHCKIDAEWLTRFEDALQNPQVAIVGPTFTQLNQSHPKGCGMMWTSEMALDTHWFTPINTNASYEVPFTPGGCQAFRSQNFEALGKYDEGFARWGSEDLELCFRAWSLGYMVKVDPKVTVQHYFRQTRNFTVETEDVAYNYLRMVYFHFSEERIDRIQQEMVRLPEYNAIMRRIEESNVFELRHEIEQVRVKDDNWFFTTFAT